MSDENSGAFYSPTESPRGDNSSTDPDVAAINPVKPTEQTKKRERKGTSANNPDNVSEQTPPCSSNDVIAEPETDLTVENYSNQA